jgi:hypothetical protein
MSCCLPQDTRIDPSSAIEVGKKQLRGVEQGRCRIGSFGGEGRGSAAAAEVVVMMEASG